jgi:HSP20 family protein
MAQFTILPAGDSGDLAIDVRQLFEELAGSLPHEQRAYSGQCTPALDVLETDEAVEVMMDASGVPAEAIRVLFRDGMLVVAGEKAPHRAQDAQSFHLLEREFGRFARAVRLEGAFDLEQSRAVLRDGELIVTLPKRVERRGQAHRIPIHLREGSHQ